MCLIVDTNELKSFFKDSEYSLVRDWVRVGNGKLIQGGSTYKAELKKAEGLLSVLTEWGIANSIAHLPDDAVDQAESDIVKHCTTRSDDPHILAMIIVSGCRVICTKDKNLIVDFRGDVRRRYGFRRLKIFRNRKKHAHMACERNIVPACRK